MLHNPDSEFAPEVPSWLSSFVHFEIRPFILNNRQAVLDALDRWLCEKIRQQLLDKERKDWKDDFISRLPEMSTESWHGPVSPGAGFSWCERWRDPFTGEHRDIKGWLPPSLGPGSDAPREYLLPPPTNRDLWPDECIVALLAVHDEVRDPRERIGPDIHGTFTGTRTIPFVVLRKSLIANSEGVGGLSEGNLPYLKEMLKRATDSVNANVSQRLSEAKDQKEVSSELTNSTAEQAEKNGPDGFFGTNGFRFADAEVNFGHATLQYALVKSLWDTAASDTFLVRKVSDVMNEVWGNDHQTEDPAFRQLCSEVRRRFEISNCPLDIDVANGLVQLKRT